MSAVERYTALQLAVRLVRHGVKLSIVHSGTGVARDYLRTLHREIHGHSPRGGPLVTSVGTVIKTRPQQAQASLFAALYMKLDGHGLYQAINYTALLDAFEMYLALLPTPQAALLDINLAWATARDLRGGQADLQHCPACAVGYLVMRAGHIGSTCPLCSLYARVEFPALVPRRAGPGHRRRGLRRQCRA